MAVYIYISLFVDIVDHEIAMEIISNLGNNMEVLALPKEMGKMVSTLVFH